MAQAATAAEGAPTGKKKKLLVPLIAAGLLLAGGGGGYFYWQSKAKAPAGEAEGEAVQEAPHAKPSVFMTLELFTVNLHSEESDHFMQVGMVLELDGTDTQKVLTDAMPVLRGNLLLLLSSQNAKALLKPEGKLNLAKAITAEVRSLARTKAKGVRGVHFSAFVIQ